jgi:hypothetical protein
MGPFPIPAHRTKRADFLHSALRLQWPLMSGRPSLRVDRPPSDSWAGKSSPKPRPGPGASRRRWWGIASTSRPMGHGGPAFFRSGKEGGHRSAGQPWRVDRGYRPGHTGNILKRVIISMLPADLPLRQLAIFAYRRSPSLTFKKCLLANGFLDHGRRHMALFWLWVAIEPHRPWYQPKRVDDQRTNCYRGRAPFAALRPSARVHTATANSPPTSSQASPVATAIAFGARQSG